MQAQVFFNTKWYHAKQVKSIIRSFCRIKGVDIRFHRVTGLWDLRHCGTLEGVREDVGSVCKMLMEQMASEKAPEVTITAISQCVGKLGDKTVFDS